VKSHPHHLGALEKSRIIKMDFIDYYSLLDIITCCYQLLVVVEKKPHSHHPGGGKKKSPG
jgi:hypothetical protein